MIRRRRSISFRLTFEEEERFGNTMRSLHCWGWSQFIRVCLAKVTEEQEQRASDNNVLQPIARKTPPAVSDKSTGPEKKTSRKILAKSKKK